MVSLSAEDILNPKLDLAPYREEFDRRGRVQVPDILLPEFAEEIHAVFQRAPWGAVFLADGKPVFVSREGLAAYTSRDRMNLRTQIFAETSKGFQYSYRSLSLEDAKGADWDEKQALPALVDFMSSEKFLDIGRSVSGFEDICSTSVQATCYLRESFLSAHDDVADDKMHRRVAYVLGLTKDWKFDWGGFLQFLDPESGRVIDSFPPAFNVLTLFRVPQWHSVSFVTPFAMGQRLSLLGWYYGAEAKINENQTKASGPDV